LRIAKWNGSAWSPLGTGINCGGCATPIAVLALQVFDDGSGPALYVGGRFDHAGGLSANSIARWNGTNWSTLGSGFGAPIRALAVFDAGSGPRLYAGGDVLVSVWTGSTWASLAGAPHSVYALAVFDDGSGPGLYATGGVSSPSPGAFITRWNGSTWSSLGSGVIAFHCSPLGGVALTVFDDGTGPALYTGGCFATTSPAAEFVARWNGLAWSAVQEQPAPAGFDQYADALTTFNDGSGTALYAGGGFELAGGVPASGVARWTGSSWGAVGGANEIGNVSVLAVADLGLGPALYAGGNFTTVNGIPSPSVAMWNGSHWTPLGTGIAGSVDAIAAFNDGTGPQLYAAGYFFAGSGGASSMIRRWNGSTWNEVGRGLNAFTYALVVFDDGSGPALYAGGTFAMAGGQPAHNIARWNGTTWSAVGGGLNDWVYALTVHEENGVPVLIAGGQFTMAGGVPANGVARWDGTAWTPLGAGVNGSAYALTSLDDGTGPALFVGGIFTSAGGAPAANIARWNGSSWSALGQGTDSGVVSGLAAFDDGSGGGADLYAVGNFSTAGTLGSGHIGVWRGCAGPGTMLCFGDGSAVPCPCVNNGRDAHGCQNSASTGGSQIHSSGATHPDTVVLSVTGELPSALSIFLQGNVQIAPVAFGDGLRCAGGLLKRLYVKSASGGATFAPAPGDPPISVRSANLGDPIAPGSMRIYQTYYRDPSLTFCPSPAGDTWNVSNGVRITW
jgi:hypothetical protein